ncbi:hypothetical protein LQW54_010131 [Pestalotiopsis sp. IQ-011]
MAAQSEDEASTPPPKRPLSPSGEQGKDQGELSERQQKRTRHHADEVEAYRHSISLMESIVSARKTELQYSMRIQRCRNNIQQLKNNITAVTDKKAAYVLGCQTLDSVVEFIEEASSQLNDLPEEVGFEIESLIDHLYRAERRLESWV